MMLSLPKGTRTVLVVAACADMTLFSQITTLSLIAIAVGAIMIALGIEYSYKLSSYLGLFVSAGTGAATVEIGSLVEFRAIVVAVAGVLIPVLLLTWLALSAEEWDNQPVSFMRRPEATAFAYSLICLLSVPLVIFITSLVTPALSIRITTMTEAAIVMIFTISGGMLLTRKRKLPWTSPSR